MISTEDLVEAFDDLGYTLEDPKVIDKLCGLCDLYGVDETKVSCEYLAFAKKKNLNAPSLEIVDLFDNEVLKGLQKKQQENIKKKVFDSSTIAEMLDQDEEDVLDNYGTPKTIRTKRQITPDVSMNKKRFGLNETFSPESFSQNTPTTTVRKSLFCNSKHF